MNLVENALQATESDDRIIMRARMDGQQLLLEVEDTGCGIKPVILENAFTPFYTTREKGTGLGLPLAQKFARDHQGRAEIHSALGKGTRIALPAALGGGTVALSSTCLEGHRFAVRKIKSFKMDLAAASNLNSLWNLELK